MLSAKDFVNARLYPDETALMQDALRHLLRARPGLRLAPAVHKYAAGEVSLVKAAKFASVGWAQMILQGFHSPVARPAGLDRMIP